jgi:predicted nucleotide-binding protein
VVLLTADDRGGPIDQAYEKQSARARQNMIFELGFFIGKLGRDRVCALYEEGVEVPSDYQGVVFYPV